MPILLKIEYKEESPMTQVITDTILYVLPVTCTHVGRGYKIGVILCSVVSFLI